jgi:hypothetical protein
LTASLHTSRAEHTKQRVFIFDFRNQLSQLSRCMLEPSPKEWTGS